MGGLKFYCICSMEHLQTKSRGRTNFHMGKLYTLSIEKEMLEKFKDIHLTGIIVKNLKVKSINPNFFEPYISGLNELYKQQDVTENEEVKKWRNIYKEMGLKPSKYHCSFESILRRYLKGFNFLGINNVVDSYNSVSLLHQKCIGGYDLDKIQNKITLRFAKEGETCLPIGASEPISLSKNSVVYADEEKVLCSYWNYRDSEYTKITENTKNSIFFIDEIDATPKKGKNAIKDLANLLKDTCDAQIIYQFELSNEYPTNYFEV
ncbi:B3/B4 domain-containing protein [Bacillus subtilis]|nr:phenylalanine--tRNA ligase beta subunit-related protein [Bacillus subtilis]